MATVAKSERMELRLPREQKGLFEAAATARGLNLTQWALSALSGAAQRDLEQAQSVMLSAKNFDAFAAALEEPMPDEARELLARTPVWES